MAYSGQWQDANGNYYNGNFYIGTTYRLWVSTGNVGWSRTGYAGYYIADSHGGIIGSPAQSTKVYFSYGTYLPYFVLQYHPNMKNGYTLRAFISQNNGTPLGNDGAWIQPYSTVYPATPTKSSFTSYPTGTQSDSSNFVLSWSASTANPVGTIAYQLQRSTHSYPAIGWGVIYTGTARTYTDTSVKTSWNQVRYRIVALNKYSDDFYGSAPSDTTPDIIISHSSPKMHIKKSGSWSEGNAFINRSGTWTEGKETYIKNNGVWVQNK